MGCLVRLGCLFVLAVAAVVGWFTRDRWLPERFRHHGAAVAVGPHWEPLSNGGAERTHTALTKLSQPKGPVFQTLSGSDVASYVFLALAKQLPSADSIQTMVSGDRISMRADLRLADIGDALGPAASLLGDRAKVQLSGTLRVTEPGLAEFDVLDVKVGKIAVPQTMVPALIRRLDRTDRPPSISDNGLPVPIPSYVGDIRVANGKITLYKNVK